MVCWKYRNLVLTSDGKQLMLKGAITKPDVTDLQHWDHRGNGWKGPMEVIQSNLPLGAGSSPVWDQVTLGDMIVINPNLVHRQGWKCHVLSRPPTPMPCWPHSKSQVYRWCKKHHSTTSHAFQYFDFCCGEPGRENTSKYWNRLKHHSPKSGSSFLFRAFVFSSSLFACSKPHFTAVGRPWGLIYNAWE